MCYPVCGMVTIKDPLLLIRKTNSCSGGNRLPFSLSLHLNFCIELFSISASAPQLVCQNVCGIYSPVCGMVTIKDSQCGFLS